MQVFRKSMSPKVRDARNGVSGRKRCGFAVVSLLAAAAFTAQARADVRLHPLFSDNMVLQQGRPVPVWGWANKGEKIAVHFQGQVKQATARNGRWRVDLEPLLPGGPFVMEVKGRNQIILTNVLVGEVWVCSGQSNMEFPLSRAVKAKEALAAATNSMLRLFTVPRTKSQEPLETVKGKWSLCSPEAARNFSAVAYFFGQALQKARKIPVGLIHTSWGGSPAEAWMSRDALMADPVYRKEILKTYAANWRRYEEARAAWQKEAKAAKAAGKKFNKRPPRSPWWRCSELYNGMIAPLIPFAIRGAIWYQGESNAGRAYQYRRLFPDMIRNWREKWGQGDFPFLAVQLAPWDKNRRRSIEEIAAQPVESDWAELREAQVLAARILPNVGIAVITDVGDKDDIHPRNKQPVGERLALAARVIAYGEPIDGLSPLYRSVEFKNGKAIVHFDYVKGPLKVKGDKLLGFAVAGPDRKFVWAEARVNGKTVEVWSPKVPNPVAVRFGWADYPVVNLYSSAGLPVSPFRTDDWPMVTQPKE